ncbi:MAG: hypothetical protein U1G07_07785 [Verrucomicrobiota bacterium]
MKGYFRWLESRAYKMHVRVLLSRYRAYQTCTVCGGRRFQPDSLLFKATSPVGEPMTLAEFYGLTVVDALRFIQHLAGRPGRAGEVNPLTLALHEVASRLGYLNEVGLGYLTLDRPTRSLSGGETERVNLTTCLGTRLVNTLFVLDEPTVGLHARDTHRLVKILVQLRQAGNTVVVVEHEPSVMRAADQLIDLGPGHGESGGALVFQGTFPELLKSDSSLTGRFLAGREAFDPPRRRPVVASSKGVGEAGPSPTPQLHVVHATRHNLRDLSVAIPLERLVCITGVSGSGKSTLLRDVLLPLLRTRLENANGGGAAPSTTEDSEAEVESEPEAEVSGSPGDQDVHGWEALGRVVFVDQSPLGKTPRSNPAVYIGAFEHIRQLYALSEAARQHGLNASAFSFNSAQGQCEQCRGAGFEKIEMQFLSDVYIRCPACNGRRYRQHILNVKIGSAQLRQGKSARIAKSGALPSPRALSIADLLETTVDEAIAFLQGFEETAASRAVTQLTLLQEVGLGYLRLGQPINTLSGGESQRLKLVSHLAEFAARQERERKPTLFLFDEPTTGLHFADVRVLIQVLQRLVDERHSVVVIEHNLDLIQSADWVIDMGPEAGAGGGRVVAVGSPETIAA